MSIKARDDSRGERIRGFLGLSMKVILNWKWVLGLFYIMHKNWLSNVFSVNKLLSMG